MLCTIEYPYQIKLFVQFQYNHLPNNDIYQKNHQTKLPNDEYLNFVIIRKIQGEFQAHLETQISKLRKFPFWCSPRNPRASGVHIPGKLPALRAQTGCLGQEMRRIATLDVLNATEGEGFHRRRERIRIEAP